MSRALNCQIIYKEGKVPTRSLTFVSGKIKKAEDFDVTTVSGNIQEHLNALSASGGRTKNKSYALLVPIAGPTYPWQKLSLDTYDRCRVLLTELGRLISKGRMLPLRDLVYRSKID